jgi:hypothetical protein
MAKESVNILECYLNINQASWSFYDPLGKTIISPADWAFRTYKSCTNTNTHTQKKKKKKRRKKKEEKKERKKEDEAKYFYKQPIRSLA